jgi:esterase/lipase
MFRARFKREIVAEFLPPARRGKKQKAIVLCDGMPSIPRKQSLAEFLSRQGYWVFYPRYRGTWESDGEFLQKSPHLDILDVIEEIPKGVREVTFGEKFTPRPEEVLVIGGSFGGAASILASLDPRVKKCVANCPVVDWKVLGNSERAETSNPKYSAYIREAFGRAYRLSDRNWLKLRRGDFYNPAHHIKEIDPSKVMMFHAWDDPYIPYKTVARFAEQTGIRLKSLRRGGHISTDGTVRKYWPQIKRFFEE